MHAFSKVHATQPEFIMLEASIKLCSEPKRAFVSGVFLNTSGPGESATKIALTRYGDKPGQKLMDSASGL